MLHVPVKEIYSRHCNVKQRYPGKGGRFCAIQFTKRRVFCCGDKYVTAQGRKTDVEILGRRKRIYASLRSDLGRKSRRPWKSLGGEKQPGENRKYWMHLKHLSEHYAHEISSQIIGFCLEKAGFADRPSKIQKRIHRLCDDRIRKLEALCI